MLSIGILMAMDSVGLGTPAPSGPALAQEFTVASNTSNASKTVTPTTPPTVGNSLILCIEISGANTVTGITGGGCTWAVALQFSVDSITTEIWYGHANDGSSGTITVTLTGASRTSIDLTEWSGLKNAGPEGVQGGMASAGVTATVATGSVTPVSAKSVTMAAGGWTANGYLSGPINGYTRLTPVSSTLTFLETAYLVKTSAAATSTGWTLTSSLEWGTVLATFGAT